MSAASFHFSRRLSPDFIDALGDLADPSKPEGQWWRDVLVHPDLILAVRKDSLNVYYRGQSIFRISWKEGRVVPETHFKYLVRQKQALVKLSAENRFAFEPKDFMWSTYEGRSALEEMIKAASNYAGPEKIGLHALIKASSKSAIIDVEVAFRNLGMGSSETDEVPDEDGADDLGVLTNGDGEDTTPSAKQEPQIKQDRLDAVTLEERAGTLWIVFHEAKHFANKELRASDGRIPAVGKQVARYRETIGKYASEITTSYRDVCQALIRLDAMRVKASQSDSTARHPSLLSTEALALISHAADEATLQIDPEPRLIVFGLDKDQRDGAWRQCHDRLNALGLTVYAIGNPRTGGASAFRFDEKNRQALEASKS